MSEEELLKACHLPKSSRNKVEWVSEAYGLGISLRKFGYYPKNWPLNIRSAHGVALGEKPSSFEIYNDAPVILYFSKRKVIAFKQVSSKKSFCVVSPNVFYRRSNKIEQDVNSSGTIAFLAHSTSGIEDKMNHSEYAMQLLNLPSKFHPVTVCLHYNDVRKGIYRTFHDAGLSVITAGNPFDDLYMVRFYDMLKKFRFSTSNGFGSYLFYCVEMNIPFFFYGTKPDFYHSCKGPMPGEKFNFFDQSKDYETIRSLFPSPAESVTEKQKSFVETELGITHSISRFKLAYILYSTFTFFEIRKFKRKIYSLISNAVHH